MTIAEDAFRRLREYWFDNKMASHAHERVWEDEETERIRNDWNTCVKKQYDKDTEEILAGKPINVAPRCPADLGKP